MEKALKRFKRLVEKEGIIREFKKREYFIKPSLIKSRQAKDLKRKIAKKLRKANGGSKNY